MVGVFFGRGGGGGGLCGFFVWFFLGFGFCVCVSVLWVFCLFPSFVLVLFVLFFVVVLFLLNIDSPV